MLIVIWIFLIVFLATLIPAQQQVSNKVLCESSDGKWINEQCICPSNSVGFKGGFGCDYKTEPKNSGNTGFNPTIIILLGAAIVFLIILILLIKLFRKRK